MSRINQRNAGQIGILRGMVVNITRHQYISSLEDGAVIIFGSGAAHDSRFPDRTAQVAYDTDMLDFQAFFDRFDEFAQSSRFLQLAYPAQSEAAAFQIHGIEIISDLFIRMCLQHCLNDLVP
ncbi:hypothetical protein D3C75_1072180 [compost metagenome]